MMSNYSFSGGGTTSNHGMRNENSLELTEKEMQDLADSISPIHSFDSLSTLNEGDNSRMVQNSALRYHQSTMNINNVVQRQIRAVEQSSYFKEGMSEDGHQHLNMNKRPLSMESRSEMSAPSAENRPIQRGQSDAAKERRRERNRLLAKKTRVKNKNEVENLRKEIEALKNENDALKQSIKEIVSTKQPSTLGHATNMPHNNSANNDPIMLAVKEIVTMMEHNGSGGSSENTYQRSFCISNALAQGNPLLYSSHGYAKMSSHHENNSTGHNDHYHNSTDSAMSSSKSGTEAHTDSSSSLGPQSDSNGSENGSGSDEDKPDQKKSKKE